MREISKEELKEILERHRKWRHGEDGGERADLRDAYLRGADLRDAYLRGADLRGADLRDAYLRGADLRGAYLRGAYLRDAYLRGADLRDADLRGAYLRGAYLRGADLRGAYLRGAYLRGAYLREIKSLWGATGNQREIKSLFVSEDYPITYTDTCLQIGCEKHEIKDWWEFDSKRIAEMDGKKALRFWKDNKDYIKQTIEKFPAVVSIKGE